MAEKIGEASGYRTGKNLNRLEFPNAQKESYGLPGDSGKKSRYSEVYGKRPATFGDYFKDAKDQFGKLKKMASKIDGMSKSPEPGETPIEPSEVPDDRTGQTRVQGDASIRLYDEKDYPDSEMPAGVFQKSNAYGKAMMRSGLYQKSYNAKKYK